ncbi:uncharacterized protein LOC26529364 [Drosophila willistoni]|uniref:uncharacterized protein LOC26529364 n=1 Tax=Drosophila willistoni TaxID=7260 RepID=UPI001F08754B|nr:uncharacterized protein LOC26529364 [Drosophila willistoni]
MKLTLTLLVIISLCLFALALGNVDTEATKPPFVRSRYSLRWRRTTEPLPKELMVTSTDHPKASAMVTSTAGTDYDYYGNGEAENIVPKVQN